MHSVRKSSAWKGSLNLSPLINILMSLQHCDGPDRSSSVGVATSPRKSAQQAAVSWDKEKNQGVIHRPEVEPPTVSGFTPPTHIVNRRLGIAGIWPRWLNISA
jgi:hypothetical protein